MPKNDTQALVLAALLAALVAMASLAFVIALPGSGYANLGDAFVITCGLLLGPLWGGIAAAVGATLADIFLGYAVYAPATFIIKAVMAAAAWRIFSSLRTLRCPASVALTLCAICAELIMVAGYFAYDTLLYDRVVATAALPGNVVQGIIGTVAATLLLSVLLRNTTILAFFPRIRDM